ncbi:MAG: hypothetical protein ABFS12_01575 [Bacteroidota bacterium]
MNNIPAYKTKQLDTGVKKVRYLFESVGKNSIIKAIEYTYVRKISGRKVFNLGFGDYDEEDGTINDDSNSNNGDMRKVFSTVLNTVSKFFTENNDSAIWVQGSDSASDFKSNCKLTCTKNCKDICKNYNRRIRAYRYYVDRNFVDLSKEYIFFGYIDGENHELVQYVPGNDYIGILIFKKK